MSEEESTTADALELTHHVYASLNGRDLDAIMSFFAPDSVLDASRWDLGVHAGPKAIHRYLEDSLESLYEYGVQVEEMQDLGNGVIYVVQVAHRAAASHAYVEIQSAPVFVWADGMLERVTLYTDVDEARAAAERLAEERG
jgi:ketosteroid isomerase-like protein